MPTICFYFQVHQPLRVKKYSIFQIGKDHLYFNDDSESNLNNKKVLAKVIEKSYLPANELILKLLKKHPQFKVSYSLSGVLLDQLEKDFPQVIKSFQKLAKTGQVEFLGETYYHSLSFLYSKKEFLNQIKLHAVKIKKLFGQKPKVFRNTELIYNNDLAKFISKLGYKGILAEGADHILDWQSPNWVYRPKGIKKMALLVKNYRLSDDIAFRFSAKSWSEHPLTATKFAQWLSAINGHGQVVNLFMDYETFGEHQWSDTGIFNFLKALPGEVLKNPENNFMTPSGVIKKYKPVGELNFPNFVSWADVERDLSAWRSNPMQHDALKKLYNLEKSVLRTKNAGLMADWRYLQSSDHFYYMCVKWFADGDVHKYFNPYESPYDAFITFMNVVNDLKLRVIADQRGSKRGLTRKTKK